MMMLKADVEKFRKEVALLDPTRAHVWHKFLDLFSDVTSPAISPNPDPAAPDALSESYKALKDTHLATVKLLQEKNQTIADLEAQVTFLQKKNNPL
ncbi:MAG: hypothetical protein ACREL1_00330 [bacterium]